MKFWITKNSELSVREQLVRQVILAILSEDLPAGDSLPSTRAMARRYKIHSNTVSAAYHQLLEQGWLELRRGSGLYVSPRGVTASDGNPLDALLAGVLRDAQKLGHAPEHVLNRLERMLRPGKCTRIVLVEPDPAMREILLAEMREHLSVTVEAVGLPTDANIAVREECVITSLPMRAPIVRQQLAADATFVALRLRSVRGSLEGQTRPIPNAILTIVSGSAEFRQWSRAVLIAVGIEPDCLCDVDTGLDGWQDRARAGTLAIADVVAAQLLPPVCPFKAFPVIADASIAELSQLCGAVVTPR